MWTGEWRSRLRAFGLTLLPLLVFVLRGGLPALEWLLHVLGRLVGRSVIVHGILGLAFLGDAHDLVAVGIYPRGLWLTLFGIVLEIDGTVVAEFVLGLAYEDFLACEVIGLRLSNKFGQSLFMV